MGRIQISKTKTFAAILGSGGVVSVVAKRLGVAWHTADKYIQKWKDTRLAFEAEKEALLDVAEKNIIGSIKKGSIDVSKWYLTKKGKERGYNERQEIDHTTKGEKIESGETLLILPINGLEIKEED